MKTLLNLVGQTHRPKNVQNFLRTLDPSQDVLLVREPGNPYDPNAIQVYVHIGYIKAKQAAPLAAQMDATRYLTTPMMDAQIVEARGYNYVTLEVDTETLEKVREYKEAPEEPPKHEVPRTVAPAPKSRLGGGDDEIPF